MYCSSWEWAQHSYKDKKQSWYYRGVEKGCSPTVNRPGHDSPESHWPPRYGYRWWCLWGCGPHRWLQPGPSGWSLQRSWWPHARASGRAAPPATEEAHAALIPALTQMDLELSPAHNRPTSDGLAAFHPVTYSYYGRSSRRDRRMCLRGKLRENDCAYWFLN